MQKSVLLGCFEVSVAELAKSPGKTPISLPGAELSWITWGRGQDGSMDSPALSYWGTVTAKAAFSSHWETWAVPALLYVFQQLLSQGNHINKAKDKRDKAHWGNRMKLELHECWNTKTWQTYNVNNISYNWASEFAVKGIEYEGKNGKREGRNKVHLNLCMELLK